MKLKRTILMILTALAILACRVEGDPCARLCRGREGSDWTTCYEACEEGQ